MHEALCRSSGTTLDSVHAEDGPPITERTSGLGKASKGCIARPAACSCSRHLAKAIRSQLSLTIDIMAQVQALLLLGLSPDSTVAAARLSLHGRALSYPRKPPARL